MHLGQVLTLTLIPVTSTILGGAIASVRQPSDSLRSFVQHFAAGLVIAVVAGELLPELTRTHELWGIVLGFVLGVLVMLSMGKSTLTVAGLALLVAAGATIGGVFLGGLSEFPLAMMLAFGAAALLFLVTEELLIEAHEVKQTPWITSAFFAGFLALYVIEMVSG